MGNGKNKTDRNKIDRNKTKKTVATTKKKEAGKAAKQQETSFLRMKDHLVEQARGFNLLSNVFMSVALNDIPACQHVIRIITGNPSLTVKKYAHSTGFPRLQLTMPSLTSWQKTATAIW